MNTLPTAPSRLDRWLNRLQLGPQGPARVLVSACLLGHAVRHDGGHRRHQVIARVLPRWLQLTPLCPEVAIGLPVPRPPIDPVRGPQGGIRILERERGTDHTRALEQVALLQQDPVDGVILKQRSPSCGLGSARLLEQDGTPAGVTDGATAAALCQRFPQAVMAEDSCFDRREGIELFVLRAVLGARLRQGLPRHWLAAELERLTEEEGPAPPLAQVEVWLRQAGLQRLTPPLHSR